jgi:hypothetical protein
MTNPQGTRVFLRTRFLAEYFGLARGYLIKKAYSISLNAIVKPPSGLVSIVGSKPGFEAVSVVSLKLGNKDCV